MAAFVENNHLGFAGGYSVSVKFIKTLLSPSALSDIRTMSSANIRQLRGLPTDDDGWHDWSKTSEKVDKKRLNSIGLNSQP